MSSGGHECPGLSLGGAGLAFWVLRGGVPGEHGGEGLLGARGRRVGDPEGCVSPGMSAAWVGTEETGFTAVAFKAGIYHFF